MSQPSPSGPSASAHAAAGPKVAVTDHPIHPLLAQRWSPYGFSGRAVPAADVRSLFEAARWAASSYNEQPWRFLVATQADAGEYSRMLSCLVEANQAWAKSAPVLALACTHLNFARHGKPNAAAVHDLGLATASLLVEATARGLHVHPMIGILSDRVRELYAVPADVQPLTALAIGYAADAAALPDALRQRDQAPRTRKPLTEIVFAGQWGAASDVVRSTA